ncbi:g8245 [Coccomyxa elongata]
MIISGTSARVSASIFTHRRARRLFTNAMSQGEEFLHNFVNYEKKGVPDGAGKDDKGGFDMGRMHRLLNALGDPHLRLPVVHVAGTKGKGSTVAMLSSIMQAASYNVGTYTSPHVTTLRERISINGQPIPEASFNALIRKVETKLVRAREEDEGALSHFEVMTALAFTHFQDQQVDIAIVEAGLGGARDATNVFSSDNLKLAIITAIGLEHQKALGSTLGEIAAAKAGIMKKGRPAVVARQPEDEALQELLQRAAERGSEVIQAPDKANVASKGIIDLEGRRQQRVVVSTREGTSGRTDEEADAHQSGTEVNLQLMGDHQLDNAATATAAACLLKGDGFPQINEDTIAEGLSTASLPGRFQVVRLPHASEQEPPWLVLDGAHTPASAAALVKTLAQVFPGHPLAFVVGMADDKDHSGFLAHLRDASPKAVIFTSVPIAGAQQRSVAPGKLAAHWQAVGLQLKRPQRCRELIQASLPSAVETARRELTSTRQEGVGVICVCGSLHAISEALSNVQFEN